jgi:dephospho-CoA kinase
MRLIGITGGIGTGKSTVTNYLHSRYNLPVLDADIYSRSAVAIGSPILHAIAQHYGNDILQPDGTLDRRQLGQIIFSDLNERQWLETQIHPHVRACFEAEISKLASDAIAVLAIPLLFEAQMTDLVTETWVVSCDFITQLNRIMTRDRLTEVEAKMRIGSQMSISDKIALADVTLDNSTSLNNLERQIEDFFRLRSGDGVS